MYTKFWCMRGPCLSRLNNELYTHTHCAFQDWVLTPTVAVIAIVASHIKFSALSTVTWVMIYEQALLTVDTQGLKAREKEDCNSSLTRVPCGRLKKTRLNWKPKGLQADYTMRR